MSLNNIETGINITYIDETGTHYLYEGDKVICHVGDKTYNGVLSLIGIYENNSDLEAQQVICIDTWKGRTSITREIIMLKDITNICKNPFYESERLDNKDQDILNEWIKRGYNKAQAKAICDRMHDMTVFYCIPYIKATTYAVEAVRNIISDKTDAKDIIMDAAKQCIEEAQREFFELIGIYVKEIEQCDRDTSCLTDVLNIVSKCWNDLEKQKTKQN